EKNADQNQNIEGKNVGMGKGAAKSLVVFQNVKRTIQEWNDERSEHGTYNRRRIFVTADRQKDQHKNREDRVIIHEELCSLSGFGRIKNGYGCNHKKQKISADHRIVDSLARSVEH